MGYPTISGHGLVYEPPHLNLATVLSGLPVWVLQPIPTFSLERNGPVWPLIPSVQRNTPIILDNLTDHGISVLIEISPSAILVSVTHVSPGYWTRYGA